MLFITIMFIALLAYVKVNRFTGTVGNCAFYTTICKLTNATPPPQFLDDYNYRVCCQLEPVERFPVKKYPFCIPVWQESLKRIYGRFTALSITKFTCENYQYYRGVVLL